MSDETVHIGRNGWLFLFGGNNKVRSLFCDPDYFSSAHLEAWIALLRKRASSATSVGAKYTHLFAPDKISVYPEECLVPLPYFDRRPNNLISGAMYDIGMAEYFLDAEAVLRTAKQESEVYWKTDTHWTQCGTLAVYSALCAKFGVTPRVILKDANAIRQKRLMDLGNKLSPPVYETITLYEFPRHARIVNRNICAEESERRGGNIGRLQNGIYVTFVNEHKDAYPAKVMIFGSSFSGVHPRGLTSMLAETFREVHFFWSSFMDHGIVNAVRPDIVISETAERFAVTVPIDTDFHTYAIARHKAYLATLPS
jgi:hypothetical protein